MDVILTQRKIYSKTYYAVRNEIGGSTERFVTTQVLHQSFLTILVIKHLIKVLIQEQRNI